MTDTDRIAALERDVAQLREARDALRAVVQEAKRLIDHLTSHGVGSCETCRHARHWWAQPEPQEDPHVTDR